MARALGEALVFSGLEAGELDVTFLASSDAAVAGLARVAVVFEVPELVVEAAAERGGAGDGSASRRACGEGNWGFHTPRPPWSIFAKMKRNFSQIVWIIFGVYMIPHIVSYLK